MVESSRTNPKVLGATLLTDQLEFMAVQQSSELLSVSKWLLYEAIRLGELPVIRWAGRWSSSAISSAIFSYEAGRGPSRTMRAPICLPAYVCSRRVLLGASLCVGS